MDNFIIDYVRLTYITDLYSTFNGGEIPIYVLGINKNLRKNVFKGKKNRSKYK